jgi:hypothetical protein
MTGSASIDTIATVTPSVNIVTSSGMGDSVCSGHRTTFTAVPTNGGASPVYQWRVGGSIVGLGSIYNYTPANNDVVSVTMVSNAVCPSPDTVSDAHTIIVKPLTTPAVTITANAGTVVCPGTSVRFTASPVNGGNVPSYVWVVNSDSLATGPVFNYTPNNNDMVFVTMVSNYACRSTDNFVWSNDIVFDVNTPVMPTFSLSVTPGTVAGIGKDVTFTANVDNSATSNPTYQWTINGTAVAGATNVNFTSNQLHNGDVVCCVATGHNTCGASTPSTHCETVTIINNVGVATVSNIEADIRVIPNPNKGAFTIKGNLGTMGNDEVVLEVTNMLGQVVYSNKVNATNGDINEQVHMNAVANGMYLLNVRSGAESKTFHFVIEQ